MEEIEKALAEAKAEDEEFEGFEESRMFWALIQEKKESFRQGIAVGLGIMAGIISASALAIRVLPFLFQ